MLVDQKQNPRRGQIIIIINLFYRMHFEDEIHLPALIPIRTKRKNKEEQEQSLQSKELLSNEVMNILTKEFDKQKQEREAKRQEKPARPALGAQKIQQFDKKFHNLHEKGGSKKQERSAKLTTNKERENQKSKHIVTQMMKKIDAKNISQQLYPVTNQAILEFIKKIDLQVEQLKVTAQRKESLLVTNPNNQHLKTELESLKVSIDRCVVTKGLYNEKINLRNKVAILERNIIQLKEENENLKIKNYRELQDQENHSNGLPCYREKQLKDELTKCNQQLQKQKAMRQKLENNINDIVLNFKRLYEEADAARLIVTRKLKQIQQKQKFLNDQPPPAQSEAEVSAAKKSSPKMEPNDNKKLRTHIPQEADLGKTNKKQPNYLPNANTDGRLRQGDRNNTKMYVLQQQIMRMRGNQGTISKNNIRK